MGAEQRADIDKKTRSDSNIETMEDGATLTAAPIRRDDFGFSRRCLGWKDVERLRLHSVPPPGGAFALPVQPSHLVKRGKFQRKLVRIRSTRNIPRDCGLRQSKMETIKKKGMKNDKRRLMKNNSCICATVSNWSRKNCLVSYYSREKKRDLTETEEAFVGKR